MSAFPANAAAIAYIGAFINVHEHSSVWSVDWNSKPAKRWGFAILFHHQYIPAEWILLQGCDIHIKFISALFHFGGIVI